MLKISFFIFILFYHLAEAEVSQNNKELKISQSSSQARSQRARNLRESLTTLTTFLTEFSIQYKKSHQEFKKIGADMLQAYNDLHDGPSSGAVHQANLERVKTIGVQFDQALSRLEVAEENHKKITNQVNKTRAELQQILGEQEPPKSTSKKLF